MGFNIDHMVNAHFVYFNPLMDEKNPPYVVNY